MTPSHAIKENILGKSWPRSQILHSHQFLYPKSSKQDSLHFPWRPLPPTKKNFRLHRRIRRWSHSSMQWSPFLCLAIGRYPGSHAWWTPGRFLFVVVFVGKKVEKPMKFPKKVLNRAHKKRTFLGLRFAKKTWCQLTKVWISDSLHFTFDCLCVEWSFHHEHPSSQTQPEVNLSSASLVIQSFAAISCNFAAVNATGKFFPTPLKPRRTVFGTQVERSRTYAQNPYVVLKEEWLLEMMCPKQSFSVIKYCSRHQLSLWKCVLLSHAPFLGVHLFGGWSDWTSPTINLRIVKEIDNLQISGTRNSSSRKIRQ